MQPPMANVMHTVRLSFPPPMTHIRCATSAQGALLDFCASRVIGAAPPAALAT